MAGLMERISLFFNNRWLVFVAAMWIQSCAGIGYLFGSISPSIKSSLNYNQKQVARLGVAKDLGDSVGFLAASLSEILPLWAALLIGAIQNFVGYGWVWLIVTGRAPVLPLWASFYDELRIPAEEALLTESQKQEPRKSIDDAQEIIFSEVEDEKPNEVDLLPASERRKRIAQLQAKLAQAAAEGAVRIKKRRPRRGEDFTLMEALIKADFWLMFFSFLLGSGSGLTVIDNLGQMSQSLGYDNTHVFVSMISIWNFLGRVGGGYFSEKIVREYVYPRSVVMAVAQAIMAVGHFFLAMGWPGAMYIGTLLVGLGYGAHWAIVPAAASELFGLKKFGALYNFLSLANPAGSLIFSGLIASSIYDREAERQAQGLHHRQHSMESVLSSYVFMKETLKCQGAICYFLTSLIMSGLCIVAIVLSMILVYRTKIVYINLYGRSRT